MKYNVGDYVRLRDDLVHDRIYDRITYSKNFKEFLDGILKIQMTTIDGCYLVNNYYLSEKMLEPAFDFDYYKDQKVVVHCNTEEKANIFCRLMHQNGMKWRISQSYLEYNNWQAYKDRTCYCFNEGAYGSISCIENGNYQFIEFDDIINNTYKNKGDEKMKKFTKSDLKVGMWVQTRNGSHWMIIKNCDTFNYGHQDIALIKQGAFELVFSYTENLKHVTDSDYDIIKVFGDTTVSGRTYDSDCSKKPLIWERKENQPKTWAFNGKTYEENHKLLWTWLENNPTKNKSDYFEILGCNKNSHPSVYCFACDYSENTHKCPICDNCNSTISGCLNGLYLQWDTSTGWERSKYAHEIANLPWEEKE